MMVVKHVAKFHENRIKNEDRDRHIHTDWLIAIPHNGILAEGEKLRTDILITISLLAKR